MFSSELQKRIVAYYEAYYKSCGLQDFKERALNKLNEEAIEEKRLKRLEAPLHFKDSQSCFIMGAGTGGLAIVLKEKYGIEVSGCEPDVTALAILKEKLAQKGIDNSLFTADFGENLSFKSNSFDLVYCYTVLEHVKDVKKCLEEMIRVAKGRVYINTPDYDLPEERHYKIKFPWGPAKMPRFLSYLYLVLRGKPIKFFRSLNLLTKKRLSDMLSRYDNINFEFLSRDKAPTQEILITKKGTSL